MELQAALLDARLSYSIQQAHTFNISKTCLWSDSATVFLWLQSNHRNYKQFVALRLGEILETTDISQWRWIPSKLNVADDATKWKTTTKLKKSERWFVGPEFLQLKYWPLNKQDLTPVQEYVITYEHNVS